MLINSKILNIPPFISAQWSQIEFLTAEGNALTVNFKSGKTLEIPNLSDDIISRAFLMHGAFAENERIVNLPPIPPLPHTSTLFGTSDVKLHFLQWIPME